MEFLTVGFLAGNLSGAFVFWVLSNYTIKVQDKERDKEKVTK